MNLKKSPKLKQPTTHHAYFILLLFLLLTFPGYAQESQKPSPIIDVHVHAMKFNPAFSFDLCPWFL